jgi:single-strand DNA-binding protein
MLNTAILMGRLVADPELRHTPNNVPVTTFTIAVDRTYVKSGAERQADFIDIVAWRNTAEFVCKYFRKGQMIAVQGSIQTRSYTDSQGNKRKAFEIVADNVSFCGSRQESTGNSNYGSYNNYGEVSHQEMPPAPAPAYASGNTGDFEEIISDDDLPF